MRKNFPLIKLPAKQSRPTLLNIALIALGLTLTVVIIYIQTSHHQFLNFDDDIYVSNNHNIQTGITPGSIQWAFTATYDSNYFPLTLISHMLDYQMFGLNPGGYHLVNVLIHLINTLLIFFLLHVMTGAVWRAAIVAALFASHPLHVESVAWVSERKDLLSTLLWLLTLICYHYYLLNRTWQRYIQVIICFTAGLMAKPMLVTLPFTLLLFDHWPYNRWLSGKESTWQLFKEKIPLFSLSLLSCIITYYAQQKGNSIVSLNSFHFIDRISNAAISYIGYLNKTIWPLNLAIFYPYPDSIQMLETFTAIILLVLITFFFVVRIKAKPYLAVGWFWYLGTLVPVIGIVQVGEQAMADRYTYIPLLGIFIILVWGAHGVIARFKNWHKRNVWLSLLTLVTLIICVVLSFRQTGYWKNDIEVFKHAIMVTEKNYLAHFQLGSAYAKKENFTLAEKHLRTTIDLKPGTAQAYNNLAYVLERQGKREESLTNYQKSATLDPNNKEAHYNLGIIYLRKWELPQAIHHLQRVLQIAPGDNLAQKNLTKAKRLLAGQKINKG